MAIDIARQDMTVRFLADTGNLERGLSGMTSRFRLVSGGLKGIAAAGAAVGAISFFKSSIEEAREAAKVTRQTEAVIKSTGGTAKVTADHLGALATKLSLMSGVDDEVIQSGGNLLLTFKQIRNETGKGNDIFDQAATAALNMSAAMGKDLQPSIIQVGKALNDPIKGISALSKVGVSFTQQQKDQIKAMVESGNTLGAQKMILKELNSEFGGMAASSADAGMKSKVAWENLQESIGGKVLPVFTQVANFITSAAIPAVDKWASQISTFLAPTIAMIGNWIQTKLVPAISSVVHWVRDVLWPAMQQAWGAIAPIIMPVLGVIINLVQNGLIFLWNVLTKMVMPAISGLIGWLNQNKIVIAIVVGALLGWVAALVLGKTIMFAFAAAAKIMAAAQFILNAVMRANPIGIIITILGALVGALIYAWNHSETFRKVVTNVWNGIKNAVGAVWGFLKGVFSAMKTGVKAVGDAFGAAVKFIQKVWDTIKKIAAAPINFVIKYVYNNGIRWVWNKIADLLGLGQLAPAKEIKFAGGGVIPGYAPGIDNVPMRMAGGGMAMLSPGEAVLVPELVQQIGAHNIIRANKRASGRSPSAGFSGGGVVGFAGGGVMGKVLDYIGGASKTVVSAVTNPVGFVTEKLGAAGKWISAIASIPAKLLAKLGTFLWNKITAFIDSAMNGNITELNADMKVRALQQWALKQKGKKYSWGAVGPNTYDCSGLVGNLWAAVNGKPLYHRYMTTASMGPGRYGMKSGRGTLTVYLGPGHTAANIGGLHAEAYGGNGTPMAIGRIGTPLSYYDHVMHIFKGGGILGLKNDPMQRLGSFVEKGWPEPYVFDNGGVWRSGTLGVNTSGHDEIVINPNKTKLGGDKHYHLHANVTNHPIDLVTQFARMEMLEP